MRNIDRRKILRSASAIGVGAALIPNLLSCSPSQKVNIAIIGVGGRGRENWSKSKNENIVAMCDVNDESAAEAGPASTRAGV